MLDLVFRNENQAVERRFKRSSSHTSVASGHPIPICIPPALSHAPEQLALNFFFQNHVLIPRHSEASRGLLELLPSLYAEADAISPLSLATTAFAFAAFAKDPAGRRFLPQARPKYGEAIVRLNGALRDPVAAKQDVTLMAVLLLGVVEVRQSLQGGRCALDVDAALHDA